MKPHKSWFDNAVVVANRFWEQFEAYDDNAQLICQAEARRIVLDMPTEHGMEEFGILEHDIANFMQFVQNSGYRIVALNSKKGQKIVKKLGAKTTEI